MSKPVAAIAPRHIAAVVIGNALEFYDFLTYAFFAVYIGRAFFPSQDPSTSLLASLGTFGAGFITRPIGSVLIGRMGDRVGRKPAMFISFIMMGVALIGLALTPPYAMIGIAAPILVIFFRLLQGFALGGEVGPSTAFLMEAAPPERRGFYTAFQACTQNLAVLVSGLVGFALASTLNDRQLQDYGWRIALLLGVAIVPFGLFIRRSLPETLHAPDGEKPERIPLRPYLPVAVLGLLMLACATIGTYIRTYITTYAMVTLHMPKNVAFAATVVVGLTGMVFSLLGGIWSDRAGRKPIMLGFGVPLLFVVLPAFYAISHYRTTAVLLSATAFLSALGSVSITPMTAWLTESFPRAIRCSGVAIVYAVAIATFGGSTQYVVTWIIKVTGNALAPAWYWTAAMVVGIVAMSLARETAPRKLVKAEVIEIGSRAQVADVGSQ